ncbi:iron ABC transporter permease [Cereibacter sp. SYSU M97828]|nr:iron ABC transporter permease [Cereibacter flavus]
MSVETTDAHLRVAERPRFAPRGSLTAGAVQWGVLIATIFLVFAPLLPIIYQSFLDKPLYNEAAQLTAANYTNLVRDAELGGVLFNTFIFATITTVLAQAFGAIFAILIGRTNMPGRGFFNSFMLVPLVVSTMVLAFGWSLTYGPSGFATLFLKDILGFAPWNVNTLIGMSVVSATTQMPLSFLYCMAAVVMIDPALEDAARSCGAKPLRIFIRVTVPLMFPSLVFGTVLNFTSSLDALSIPIIFGEAQGIRLFMSFLYMKGLGPMVEPDYGLIATASLLLLGLVALLVYVQTRILRNERRYTTIGGKASHTRSFDLGRLRWPAFMLVAGYVVFFILLPIGILVLRAFTSFLSPLVPFWKVMTLQNFAAIFDSATFVRPIINTINISFFGGIVATLFVALIAIVSHRSDFRFANQLKYIAMVPRAIPGLIAGIGVFYAVVFFPPLGALSGTIFLMIFAYSAQAIPKAYGAIAPSLLQIGPDLDRAARVMGSDWWGATRGIILPLLLPGLLASFSLLFISFFKEYAIAMFLVTPGTEVIGTRLFQSWMQGEMGQVAALASVQIVLTVFFVGMLRLATRLGKRASVMAR